jgi:hypothetical protein
MAGRRRKRRCSSRGRGRLGRGDAGEEVEAAAAGVGKGGRGYPSVPLDPPCSASLIFFLLLISPLCFLRPTSFRCILPFGFFFLFPPSLAVRRALSRLCTRHAFFFGFPPPLFPPLLLFCFLRNDENEKKAQNTIYLDSGNIYPSHLPSRFMIANASLFLRL